MSSHDTAARVLAQAEVCARRAWNTLHQDSPYSNDLHPGEVFERALVRLKIVFLFPELLDWERDLLATLYWQRQALLRLIDQSPRPRPAALRIQTEDITRRLEHSYLALAEQVERLPFCRVLSPTQQVVLRREFTRFLSIETGGCVYGRLRSQ